MEMKKLTRLLVVFLLSLAISACGVETESEQSLAGSKAGASVESAIGGSEDTARDDSGSEPGNVAEDDIGNESENASVQSSAGNDHSEDEMTGSLEESEDETTGSSEESEDEATGSPEESGDETTGRPEESPGDQESLSENEGSGETLPEEGTYTAKDDVALYIHLYGKLPSNFITKKEAQKLGWEGGSLEPYAPGKCIGGSRFGNYEGLLPEAEGRFYTECDIDTLGAQKRGAKRIVFSNDGLIYYTEDHYESFELLYGEE